LSARASAFSEPERTIHPGVNRGGDGVRTLITRLVIVNCRWCRGSRDSSVVLHWSFLHSLSLQVTDHCRRLTYAFRARSFVIYHCLRSPFLRLFHPECRPVSEAVSRHAGDTWEWMPLVFRTAPDKSSTQMSITIPLCISELNGI